MTIEEFENNKRSIISRILSQYLGKVPRDNGLVSLFDLIDQVYDGVYDNQVLEQKKQDESFVRSFLSDINGCYSEARVGRMTYNGQGINSNNLPINLEEINLDIGKDNNPLLLITSSEPTASVSFGREDGEYTFIVFSDMHFDQSGLDSNFTLEERLTAFASVREKLMSELKPTGIIVTGDFLMGLDLNGFTLNEVESHRYINGIVTAANNAKIQNREEACFTIGLLGNHDVSLGSSYSDCCTKLESTLKSIFGDNAKFVGAGSARVSFGDDVIALLHSGSNDFARNSSSEDIRPIRKREKESVTLINDYLYICQAVISSYMEEHHPEVVPEKRISEAANYITTDYLDTSKINLFQYVRTQLKQNSKLYEFYKPFIECDLDHLPSGIGNDERRSIEANNFRNKPFFAHFVSLSENGLEIVENPGIEVSFEKKKPDGTIEIKNKVNDFRFDFNDYEKFFKQNEFLRSSLRSLNPYFTRDDIYIPRASIVAHYHRNPEKLSNGEIERLHYDSASKEDDSLVSSVTVMEPQGMKRTKSGAIIESTRYTLKVSNGEISNTSFEPKRVTLSRNPLGKVLISDYIPSHEASIDIEGKSR